MKKTRKISIIYGLLLLAFTVTVLLEGFVLPQTYAVVSDPDSTVSAASEQGSTNAAASEQGSTNSSSGEQDSTNASSGGQGSTNASYAGQDSNTTGTSEQGSTADGTNDTDSAEITVTTYRKYDTDIYVADIQLSDPSDLKTAFAQGIYGKNIAEDTSDIAAENDAVLAVNGDYYSARSGYVIRNGVLYRDSSSDADQEDMVIYSDGHMDIIREGDITAQELLENGAEQVLCFGPGLVQDGKVTVSEGEEVSGKSMSSNPRTAIGWISDTHYVFVVSDGRTSQSEGLDLDELAEFMAELGCQEAYNLDGGGSSTMYYEGEIINNPTSNGGKIRERSVSDIVYIQ